MDLNDCRKFANENKICHLATQEGSQPRVRALLFCHADETGFYLQIGRMKEMYGQLQKNPQVEVCFLTPKGDRMLRVAGKIEFVNDPKIRERIFNDRPFLKKMIQSPDNPNFIILRIPHGQAYFWTFETNLEPKKFISF
jgi:uncharacterized pyridoxamine 5'-phosphate oxidase family protein